MKSEYRITAAKMVLASTCLLVQVAFSSCGDNKKTTQIDDGIKVKVIAAGEVAADGDYNYSGTVEEETATSLSFQAMGIITHLNANIGDRISKGQLIATIDPTTSRNAFDMAHAVRVQAEDGYRRMKLLHDKGSLSDVKWVEAQSQLQQAVASENIAKKALGDCRLFAPVDGVVSEKLVEQGQNVAPGQPILKIATINILNVKVSIPESEMAAVSKKQNVDIIVPALNDRHYTGHVVEKGVIADPITRSYAVKVRVHGLDNQLLPGMVTKVAIKNVTENNSIVIPANLLQLADNNSYFVWINDGGKAAKRMVAIGDYTSRGVQIISGLEYGTQIITEGQQKVCNGTKIITK